LRFNLQSAANLLQALSHADQTMSRLHFFGTAAIVLRLYCNSAVRSRKLDPKVVGSSVANSVRNDLLNTSHHKKIVEVARQNLNDQEFNALMEAEKKGVRAVGAEQ
jgi:hypothetical protein